MKRILPILLSILLFGCKGENPIDRDLSAFLSTRSSYPLESTVWQHITGDKFNMYLLFQDGNASLFYGLVEDGELQRWSEFYTAKYTFGGKRIYAHLHYPFYGSDICTQEAYYIEGNGITVVFDGDIYTYYSPYTTDIEGQWMLITAVPKPWE